MLYLRKAGIAVDCGLATPPHCVGAAPCACYYLLLPATGELAQKRASVSLSSSFSRKADKSSLSSRFTHMQNKVQTHVGCYVSFLYSTRRTMVGRLALDDWIVDAPSILLVVAVASTTTPARRYQYQQRRNDSVKLFAGIQIQTSCGSNQEIASRISNHDGGYGTRSGISTSTSRLVYIMERQSRLHAAFFSTIE